MITLSLYIVTCIYWFLWLLDNIQCFHKKTKKDLPNTNIKVIFVKFMLAALWPITFPIYIIPLKTRNNEQ